MESLRIIQESQHLHRLKNQCITALKSLTPFMHQYTHLQHTIMLLSFTDTHTHTYERVKAKTSQVHTHIMQALPQCKEMLEGFCVKIEMISLQIEICSRQSRYLQILEAWTFILHLFLALSF